jgi:hypothetical protein
VLAEVLGELPPSRRVRAPSSATGKPTRRARRRERAAEMDVSSRDDAAIVRTVSSRPAAAQLRLAPSKGPPLRLRDTK